MKLEHSTRDRFTTRGLDPLSPEDRELDLALERAELVRRVRERKHALRALRERNDAPLDQLSDAGLRLGMAELSLEDFDRLHPNREGRAPA